MASSDKTTRLTVFTTWVATHIRGDEKGEAQIYLDRLFKGFGHEGWKEAGATCEKRLKNDTGGTSFADLVWKPRVVIEMKKRGVDLNKHYSQAFNYWMYLVPNRPRYAVLCNFDEFWVYDFETQMDTPVEKLKLVDLPANYGALNFLFPDEVAPVFGNHHEAVTRQAADKLAACFNSMFKRGADRELAQRFILQTLMVLFAEDIGLLEKYTFGKLLDQCKTKADTYDKLGGLFAAMNNAAGNTGGQYKGVAYFNGGLFANPAHVELVAEERTLLKEACQFDWSKVRPEIFGTIFEHSLGKEERHATGAYFTTAVDIMKIVGPTIVEPWRNAIESTNRLGELRALAHRMSTFTVLDPACGSGNFLFTAYRELKRLEAALYARMSELFPKTVDPNQRALGLMTTTNFHGMDINPFAVEIAKVTMMLAHKLSIDELHVSEAALPLDNLDANIVHKDALVAADGSQTKWPKADVIIGNPPFLDARKMTVELGRSYVAQVARLYPEVPRRADLCTYWLRRAHDEVAPCTPSDPITGRAGLVGTQNIRSNASRRGGLDHITHTGTIIEAVDNQPWSGEANVNVSIVNWVKSQNQSLLPKRRRLWSKTGDTEVDRGGLGVREVSFINSALSEKADVAIAEVLSCNRVPKKCFEGLQPGHDGFRLLPDEAAALPSEDRKTVVFPYLAGSALLTSDHKSPTEYIIDFQDMDVLEASRHTEAFDIIKHRVLPKWRLNADAEQADTGKATGEHQNRLQTWWRLKRRRPELLVAIRALSRYIVCSRVTRLPLFAFVSSEIRPDSSLTCFAFEDDYSFGVLHAAPHQQWFIAKGSKLTERLRYTPESVFDTFPWPQKPSDQDIKRVAEAAKNLRAVRAQAQKGVKGGLRQLYKTIDLPGKSPLKDAHAVLDAAVMDAYGFSAKNDLLKQLLDLNQKVAANIKAGMPVTGPGIPPGYPNPVSLVSADCL